MTSLLWVDMLRERPIAEVVSLRRAIRLSEQRTRTKISAIKSLPMKAGGENFLLVKISISALHAVYKIIILNTDPAQVGVAS